MRFDKKFTVVAMFTALPALGMGSALAQQGQDPEPRNDDFTSQQPEQSTTGSTAPQGAEPGARPGSPSTQPSGAQQSSQSGAEDPAQRSATGAGSLQAMAEQRPSELEGMVVRSSEGEQIGEVEQVVRRRDSGDLHALISSGGFIGIGADRSAVPLTQLEMREDAIVYTDPVETEQLQRDTYTEDEFEPVEDQQ